MKATFYEFLAKAKAAGLSPALLKTIGTVVATALTLIATRQDVRNAFTPTGATVDDTKAPDPAGAEDAPLPPPLGQTQGSNQHRRTVAILPPDSTHVAQGGSLAAMLSAGQALPPPSILAQTSPLRQQTVAILSPDSAEVSRDMTLQSMASALSSQQVMTPTPPPGSQPSDPMTAQLQDLLSPDSSEEPPARADPWSALARPSGGG